MSKFFYNRVATRICAKKPFIENSHYAPKKVNKRPYWLVKNMPRFILWFYLQLWMKSSKFTGKMEKVKARWIQVSLKNVSKVKDPKLSRVLIVQNNVYASDNFAKRSTCEFFSALFLLLVGSGPKRSMPIEKLGSSSLVSSIFQREGKLHCSLTVRKLWSPLKKMLTSRLIYARACLNKDFVHSGSIGLTKCKHAHYVIICFIDTDSFTQ